MFNLSIKMLKDDVRAKGLFYPYARDLEVYSSLFFLHNWVHLYYSYVFSERDRCYLVAISRYEDWWIVGELVDYLHFFILKYINLGKEKVILFPLK